MVRGEAIGRAVRLPVLGRSAWQAGGAGLLATVLYLLTLAANHSEAEDGIRYAVDVRSGDSHALSNSAHLAYNWLNYGVWHLLRALGYDGGPLHAMQVLNAVLGGIGVALLWYTLTTAGAGRVATAAGCALLALSFGYWFYSAESEVYLLSTVCLIACLGLAWRVATRPTLVAFAGLGAANGLAVLAHNTNVLFAVVAVVAAILGHRRARKAVIRSLATYAATAGLVVTAAY